MSALEPPPFLDALREELVRVTEADAQAAAAAPAGRRPRPRLPRLRMALPITVALMALATLVGVTTSGLLTTSRDDRGGEVALRDNDYSPALQQTLALLQREPVPVDELPDGISEKGIPDGVIRLSPPAPPSQLGTPLRQPAWVVPALDGDGRLALVIANGINLASSPRFAAADVRAGRALLQIEEANNAERALLVGVVPDGVERVTVRLLSGVSGELPVAANTFGMTLSGDSVVRVSWSGMDRP